MPYFINFLFFWLCAGLTAIGTWAAASATGTTTVAADRADTEDRGTTDGDAPDREVGGREEPGTDRPRDFVRATLQGVDLDAGDGETPGLEQQVAAGPEASFKAVWLIGWPIAAAIAVTQLSMQSLVAFLVSVVVSGCLLFLAIRFRGGEFDGPKAYVGLAPAAIIWPVALFMAMAIFIGPSPQHTAGSSSRTGERGPEPVDGPTASNDVTVAKA